MKKKIILDCDPGHDDAIAMMLAVGNPQYIDIACISTVGGNQVLELTTENALNLLHLMDAEIPVVPGLEGPLIRRLETAESVHGKSGLDGPALQPSPRSPEKRNFIDVYTEILTRNREKTVIVATGPQTNVATFLLARPELKDKIESIVFMGGACFGGNWSPKAEFNIFFRPRGGANRCRMRHTHRDVRIGCNPQGRDYRKRGETHCRHREPNRKSVSGVNRILLQEFRPGFSAGG